jgi:hypothetical protein
MAALFLAGCVGAGLLIPASARAGALETAVPG